MQDNKITFDIPDGFRVDVKNSNLSKGLIKFEPTKEVVDYKTVTEKLFENKAIYWTDTNGEIRSNIANSSIMNYDPNNATSKEQLECLMAYNKLRNVAEYLNGWEKFDWSTSNNQQKYFIYFNTAENRLEIGHAVWTRTSSIYFLFKSDATKAIEILGEEEIKKALFIDL